MKYERVYLIFLGFLTIFGFYYYEVFGKEVSGTADGMVSCTNNGNKISGDISITAIKNDPPIYGSWEIVANDEKGNTISNNGYFNDGDIQNNIYTFKGIETSNNICDSNTPSDVLISGNCGTEGKVQIKSENNWIGEFSGDIICNNE